MPMVSQKPFHVVINAEYLEVSLRPAMNFQGAERASYIDVRAGDEHATNKPKSKNTPQEERTITFVKKIRNINSSEKCFADGPGVKSARNSLVYL